MAVRREIGDLLRALSSPEKAAVLAASHIAGLLLERNVHYAAIVRRATKGTSARLSERYDELRRLGGSGFVEKVHGDFAALLPEEYADIVFTDDEARAIADALIDHLSGPPKLAVAAADAFVRTDRVSAVPKLTEMLQRYATIDGHAAYAAIMALQTIITAAIPSRQPLRPNQQRLIREACVALRLAATAGVQHPLDPREAAEAALIEISRHFDRSP